MAVNCSVPAVSRLQTETKVNMALDSKGFAWELLKGQYIHFEHDLSAIHVDLLAVRILDCRVITLDPDILDELGRETTFAYAACCEHKERNQFSGLRKKMATAGHA